MDRPRPGRTPLLIRVSPVPGKYEYSISVLWAHLNAILAFRRWNSAHVKIVIKTYSAIRHFELIAWSSLKYISLHFVAVKNAAFSTKHHLFYHFISFYHKQKYWIPVLFLAVLFLYCTSLTSKSGKISVIRIISVTIMAYLRAVWTVVSVKYFENRPNFKQTSTQS